MAQLVVVPWYPRVSCSAKKNSYCKAVHFFSHAATFWLVSRSCGNTAPRASTTMIGETHAAVPVQPRAALLFTGHLRSTCTAARGMEVLAAQVDACRAAFGANSCDVFLATWSMLEKAPAYSPVRRRHCSRGYCHWTRLAANDSAFPCVAAIHAAVGPLAGLLVERQDRADGHDADTRPWNLVRGETLKNFRMNGASMSAGADLVRHHAQAMGHHYTALVRMRADVGAVNST